MVELSTFNRKTKVRFLDNPLKNILISYLPDFYLPEKNLIIEVKGEYFQKRDKDIIEAKKRATIKDGYYYLMLGKKEINDYQNLLN